ncbi:hypothetical protein BH23ACT11_BH23ACT11_18880 [soil metagenome]
MGEVKGRESISSVTQAAQAKMGVVTTDHFVPREEGGAASSGST